MNATEKKNLKIQKAALLKKVQKAVELELATIPPYLMAVFSIHPDKNRIPASIIRSVFMEEMLHLTLAGNLMTALGGEVRLGKDNIPSYPLRMEFNGKGFRDREFDVHLARFSRPTINVFRKIEMPDWGDELDRNLLEAAFPVDGYTIGEFYESIKMDLINLCKRYPDRAIFSGNPAHQISEDYYWGGGGKPIEIRHLKNAIEAIDEIIEQGEGAHNSRWDGDHNVFEQREELAHYFRFNEIYYERYYKPTDPLKAKPSGEPLEVDYKAVYPIKADCKASDFEDSPELSQLNLDFNRKYSLMLRQLEEGFNGNPKVFYTAIMNGMHELSPIAYKMVQLRIPGKRQNGAPSFEWVEPGIIDAEGHQPGSASSGPDQDWHIIESVKLASSAEEVWDLVSGFFTIHTWHPDIVSTEISDEQTEERALRRLLTFPGPPVSLTTEELTYLNNETFHYKYKWVKGEWGEIFKDYKAEIKVIALEPGKKCMLQWSSTFVAATDGVTDFYRNGFKALKKKFGAAR